LSAKLVAVTVTLPAEFGAVRVAAVVLWLPNAPPDVAHLTPAAPTSFCTEAVNVTLCPITAPPRTGVIETLIAAAAVMLDGAFEYPLKLPAASVARTRYEYEVEELSPVSLKLVFVVVVI
jgi:hypothetical protein